jgi:hypothetical protein
LQDYLDNYAMPAMLGQDWATELAKSIDYQDAQRAGYHIDQSLRTHIVNGLFAITHLLEYLGQRKYYHLNDAAFKRLLVLYTLHDAYKDQWIKRHQMGKSDFSIPLARLEQLIEDMGLRRFVPDLTAAEARAASVALLSHAVGDLSDCPPATSKLLTPLHLVDSLASQQTARDCRTTNNYLHKLIATTDQNSSQTARLAARTGKTVTPTEARPGLAFYYHELDDYRGLSTLLIHQATADALAARLDLYPILYFANGTLYLGPAGAQDDLPALREEIRTRVFALLKEQAGNESVRIAKDALKYGQGLKFSKYVYLFSGVSDLLGAVMDRGLPKDPRNFASNVIAKRVDKKKYDSADEFYTRYGITGGADKDRAFAERWNAVYILLMGGENVAKALVPGDTLSWLLATYPIPAPIAEAVRQNSKQLNSGGATDHCLIIAYHWITSGQPIIDGRSPLSLETALVQQAVAERARQALEPYDRLDRRVAFVDEELGLQADVATYLAANLVFSFAPQRLTEESVLKLYEKERGYAHKRQCVICNRPIPRGVKDANIITDIAEQQAQVFSNRLLPAAEVNGQMVWCPLCYLEFMLRKISGQSYPAGSDTNISRRVYLYILPDYSFSPALWERIGQDLLGEFYPEKNTVTRLPLRGSKDKPSLPRQWLETGRLSDDWLDTARQMFAEQAARMNIPNKIGRIPRHSDGDHLRITVSAPNYLLMSYDNAASEPKLAPTRSEIWAKAVYTAVLIQFLTGARVYVTEKPYLSITQPEEMRRVIEMEGLPSLLYGLLPVRYGETATARASEGSATLALLALQGTLDILAAVWEATVALFPYQPGERRNVDKGVASVLSTLNGNPLAGATLYKDLIRAGSPPYPALTRACELLLPQAARHSGRTDGYQLMIDREGGELMNLAEQITGLSLQLYLPLTGQKGRAHRYERVFRTGIEGIKSNVLLEPDELVARVAGHILKRLPTMSGGAKPAYGDEQTRLAEALAELLVNQLFVKRCDSSISKLTHEENWIADTIYFLTAQQIGERWTAFKQRHPEAAIDPEEDTEEDDNER